VRPRVRGEVLVRYDLTLWATETAGGIHLVWTYRTDRLDTALIERLAHQHRGLLASAAAAPDTAIDALEMRLPGEPEGAPREAIKDANLGRFRSLARTRDRQDG
jgi:hypothetical protein